MFLPNPAFGSTENPNPLTFTGPVVGTFASYFSFIFFSCFYVSFFVENFNYFYEPCLASCGYSLTSSSNDSVEVE